MKQSITPSQFQKLNEGEATILGHWCFDNGYGGQADHLTIGQMIEFIHEKKPDMKGISKNRFGKWFVNIESASLGYKDEMCDALWEAVTRLLKNG